MKNISLNNILIGGLTLIAMASCSDVVDYEVPDKFSSNGAPVVNAIYDIQDTEKANPLAEGKLAQLIHIEGKNLSHVKRILFNDVEVDLKEVYAESENSYIKIPRIIPGEITDKMVYETDKGSVTIEFPITIPSVELTGLMNEFALAGTSVQLAGANFDLYKFGDEETPVKIIIHNDELGYSEELKTDSCTEEYTSIPIPEDAPDNSLITMSWEEIDGTHTKSISYRNTKMMLFGDYSNDIGSGFGDWLSLTDGTAVGDPVSLGFPFIRINGTFDAWSWNGSYAGLMWSWEDVIANPENYVFKFEVASNKAFPSYGDNGINGSRNGGFLLTLAGGANRCQWDPVSNGLFHTYGEWVTQTIPLVDVLGGGELKMDSWCNLEFVMQPNSGDQWNIDQCFGQFRIEPKTY